jgi:hypothetical protein
MGIRRARGVAEAVKNIDRSQGHAIACPCIMKLLRQKLLSTDKPVPYVDSIGASDGTGRTIAAAHIANFFREISEAHDSLVIVAAKIMIGQKTQYFRHGHALGTLPLAFVAHSAVVRPDPFIHYVQQLFILWRVWLRYRPKIHLEFRNGLHMRNGRPYRRIL